MILSLSVIISMLCILWCCLCVRMYLSNPIKRCSEALSWFYRHGNAKMRHNRAPILHELSPWNAIPSRRRSPFLRERGQLQKGISWRIELWSARREFLVHFISTEMDKITNCSPAWYSQRKNDQSNIIILNFRATNLTLIKCHTEIQDCSSSKKRQTICTIPKYQAGCSTLSQSSS